MASTGRVIAIIPVCTLSPTCSSDIATDLPVSSFSEAGSGKHDSPQSLHSGALEPPKKSLKNS